MCLSVSERAKSGRMEREAGSFERGRPRQREEKQKKEKIRESEESL